MYGLVIGPLSVVDCSLKIVTSRRRVGNWPTTDHGQRARDGQSSGILTPHSGQNLGPPSGSKPHPGQVSFICKGLPHSGQNLLPVVFAPHDGHESVPSGALAPARISVVEA